MENTDITDSQNKILFSFHVYFHVNVKKNFFKKIILNGLCVHSDPITHTSEIHEIKRHKSQPGIGFPWLTPWPNTKNPSKTFLYQMKIEAHAMIHSTMNNVLCDENNATSTSSDVTGLIIFIDFHFMIMATAWFLV